MDRREFLRFGFNVTLFALAERFLSPIVAIANSAPALSKDVFLKRLENLKSEKLTYQVYYLNFVKIAEGYFYFRPKSEKYFVAEAFAKVEGVADIFSGHKSQKLVSGMQLSFEPVPRLLPITFERTIVKRNKRVYSRHAFNYKSREWRYRVFVNGKLRSRHREEIPEGVVYENFASIPCNLRLGVYGQLQKGCTIRFRTLPFKGVDTMSIEVAGAKREAAEAGWLKGIKGAELLVLMKVTEKIMGLKPAEVLVAVDKNLTPIAGLIKDAVPVGNIYINLKSKEYIKTSAPADRPRSLQLNAPPKSDDKN